ncbi:MAG TPA: ATP-binding protein [Bryobacteraceae bacterium]
MKPVSIGLKLAFWYSLVFAAGLVLFSIVAWFGMKASLYHALDDELRERVEGVQKFMNFQIPALSLAELRHEFREHSVLGPGGDLFQVCDSSGKWLYRSAPLEKNNIAIERPSELSSPRFETRTIAGQPLRFYSQRIAVNGQTYTVQAASPMHELFEAIDRFGLGLLFAIPLLLGTAAIGGFVLSRRALDPVDQIARAAQRISIENLGERLKITETGDQLQKLSETLNQMFARLEASIASIKRFTADASHELRAPVTLIRATAEVAVQNRNRAAPEYLAALDEVLAEAERTSQLVDSLMLLARADAENHNLERTLVDLVSVCRVASDQGEKLASQHGVKFSSHLASEPISIYADGEAIRRTVLALIDNAVKYTPPGGCVDLALTGHDGYATIVVADTGMGIAQQDMVNVFERFWRADKARTRSQGGAGLGLSIVKWIVDLHGGTISVQSAVGVGSSFHVELPIAGPDATKLASL